jgi:hypothetical protein
MATADFDTHGFRHSALLTKQFRSFA